MLFTVLLVEEQKRGVGRWLKSRRPRLEKCRTLDIPWRLIRAPCGAKGPDWKGIERLAGRHKARLLCAEKVMLPSNSAVQFLSLYGLERIMAAKAICHVLQGEQTPQTVGVIDPTGRGLSAVEILLERAGCVMVHTHRPERYEWFARQMLEQKGAPVVLCQNPDMMACCRAVLLGGACPDWQQWVPRDCVVFSAVEKPELFAGKVLHSFRPGCGPELLSQIPEGVSPGLLCAGLYELAARRELARLEPEGCVWEGQKTAVENLGKISLL